MLDTENKTITGKQILSWKNTSPDTLQEFQFHLYLNAFQNKSTFYNEGGFGFLEDSLSGNIKITKIKIIGGEDLTDKQRFITPDDRNKHDKTVVSVKTKNLILPDTTIQFEIEFKAKLPKITHRTGWGKDYFFVAQWFPKIGVYETKSNQDSTNWDWNCHQFHFHSEFFADFGVYNVKMTVPSDYVLGATGMLWDEKENGNKTKTLHFKANDVVDFVWTASPNYLLAKEKWKDVNITFLYQKEHRKQIDRHISSTKIALEYFDTNLGEYPYPSITVVDPPRHSSGAGGMEYPMLITAGTVKGLSKGIRFPEMVTIHEFGHQYFMGLLASNEFEEPWLDEGINTYYETRIMNHAYGKTNSLIDFMGFKVGDGEMQRLGYSSLINLRLAASFNSSWDFKAGGYGTIIYSKSATWLQTLEGIIGTEVMDRVLQTYYDEWKFKHPKTQDFINIVNAVVKRKHANKFGENMDWFFKQVLYGTDVCDYSIHTIQNTFIEKGEDVESDGIISKVRVFRLGDMYMPNEILVHFKDGTETLETWDGKAASTVFTFKGKEIEWAQIDPENKITLDVNFANNSKTLKPETKTFWKYAQKIMFWLQNIMQFFI